MAQFHQDWSSNVVENKSNQYQQNNSGGGGGGQAGAAKKKRRRKNKQSQEQKAETEDTNFQVKHVDHKFSVALQRARIAKGWKQEDLAHRLNVHKTIVNQYESGKAVPSGQLISLMNRILEVKLPRPGQQGGGGSGSGKKKAKPKSQSQRK